MARGGATDEDEFRGYNLSYTYGPDLQRKYSKYTSPVEGSTPIERYYLGSYERQIIGNTVQHIHYINGLNGLMAMVVLTGTTDASAPLSYDPGDVKYVYTDNLGSILKVTDNQQNVIAQQNFDAWGNQRNPSDWTSSDLPSVPSWLYRGFTGHEQLPGPFNLINMNGRMYDPLLGRMLSPDNNVQNPNNTQAYNRYSYVVNNPLKYTDPTGWTSFKKFQQTYSKPLFSPNQIAQIYNTGGGNGDETDFGTPGDGTFDAFVAQDIADYNQEQATSAIVSEINEFTAQALFDENSGVAGETLNVASGEVDYYDMGVSELDGSPVAPSQANTTLFANLVASDWGFSNSNQTNYAGKGDPGIFAKTVNDPSDGSLPNSPDGVGAITSLYDFTFSSDVQLYATIYHEDIHQEQLNSGETYQFIEQGYSIGSPSVGAYTSDMMEMLAYGSEAGLDNAMVSYYGINSTVGALWNKAAQNANAAIQYYYNELYNPSTPFLPLDPGYGP